MKPHEWTNRCIADDLELHPGKDPETVAREWRQMAWVGGWHAQGRAWTRQAKASRHRRGRQVAEKMVHAMKSWGEAVERLGEAMNTTAEAGASFGRAWNRLEAS